MSKESRVSGRYKINIPLKVTLIYAVVGILWILLSDRLLFSLVKDPHLASTIAIAKGWVYVAATAWMLFFLIRGNFRAIEESKEALRTSEERLAKVVETMADGLVIIDRDGIIVFANAAAENILGIARSDIKGKTFSDPAWRITRVNGEPFPVDELPFASVIRTGAPAYGIEHAIECPNGNRAILSVNATPLRNTSDSIIGVVTSIRDITERKRAEDERRERRAHERRIREEAEKAKREFYKGTIFSVTDGKLNLVSREEIERQLAPDARRVELVDGDSLTAVRVAVDRMAASVGMSEDRIYDLVSAVGEAAANAVKHANGGTALIGIRGDNIQVCIEDHGSGMDALVLPRATLMKRYSTTTSLGLGYSLILASVDTVYLATDRHGTWVLMEKSIMARQREMSLEALPDTW